MNKIVFFTAFLLVLVGSVSAYGIYLNCPDSSTIGQTVKCSVDSDFPPGTTFDLIFSDSTNIIDRQPVTVLQNQATQYKLFDTQGLKNGQYTITIEFNGITPSMRSDSVGSQTISLSGVASPVTSLTTLTTPTPVQTTVLATSIATTQTTATPPPIQTTVLTTSIATTQTTAIITSSPNTTTTESLRDLIKEQNEKIEAQNSLIAEQNRKLSEQNDLLSQITGYFKKLFGWS